ncbi:MAG: nicotinate (nicotinamide) nucleotide adenylyltransferase [Anaerorhabdus sp.]
MKKIGCLGGSFDPIHQGHIAVANYVLKECELDEVWLIPSKETPLKNRVLTSFEQRERMIRLALKDESGLACCTIEKELPIPSYTIQTVTALKSEYPECEFYWIIGDDLVEQLPKWKEIEKLLQEIQFVVVSRNEKNINLNSNLIYLNQLHIPISSTEIRDGNFQNLNPEVRDYIFQQGLYLESIIFNRCQEYRAKHSVSVAKMALELADGKDLDKWRVYVAAILHDVCKDMSSQEQKKWIDEDVLRTIEDKEYLWHSFAAKKWIKTNLMLEDNEILNAIYHHTDGEDKSLLGVIIYLADKLERTRKVWSESVIEKAKIDPVGMKDWVEKEIEEWRNT